VALLHGRVVVDGFRVVLDRVTLVDGTPDVFRALWHAGLSAHERPWTPFHVLSAAL
jgi:hypothetical protein